MRFSEHFGIVKTDMDDWFDVDLERDSPYFIDPHSIRGGRNARWTSTETRLQDFCRELYGELKAIENVAGSQPTSPGLLRIPEPREFRLGMGGNYSSASGTALSATTNAIRWPLPALEDPWGEMNSRIVLSYIRGKDRLSDIVSTALKKSFASYTREVSRRHGIPVAAVRISALDWDDVLQKWCAGTAELPVDPQGHPIILVPGKFLAGAGYRLGDDFRESEFQEFVARLIQQAGVGRVQTGVRLSDDAMVDMVVTSGTTLHLIECKKRIPQTGSRLEEFVGQIKRYASRAQSGHYQGLGLKLVLAIPGELAATHRRYLASHEISVWDGPWLYQQAVAHGLEAEASRFMGATEGPNSRPAVTFEDRLNSVAPGRRDWSLYQRLCQEIFEYLFCPALRTPIRESTNETGVNRRDFVLPNYSTGDHWEFLRKEYRADYIVVDPKNYAGKIGKERVLQVANYLQRHGTGLFAIIVCRKGADRAAFQTIREQWILHDKMILVLEDADILQMLTDKAFGNNPVELIRQKIEDFRLSI